MEAGRTFTERSRASGRGIPWSGGRTLLNAIDVLGKYKEREKKLMSRVNDYMAGREDGL